ncbi:Methyltransferase-like protein 23 [Mortierella sp. AD094]|nr:Methyltransferase-like protein 23 [Mortierella sp. AD094]
MFNGSPDSPKVILELGAGTALPSLILAKATRDNFLIVTDRPDVPQILINVQEALKENGVQTLYPQDPNARVLVRGLGWGDFTFASEQDKVGGLQQLLKDISCIEQINNLSSSSSSSRSRGQIDLILGSDVFYNPPDFEPLLATVSFIINRHNPDCVFLTTYQNRSAKRNIDQLLQKWGLEGRVIDWEEFGFDMSKFVTGEEEEEEEEKEEEEEEENKEMGENAETSSRDWNAKELGIDTARRESKDDHWERLAKEEIRKEIKESKNTQSLGEKLKNNRASLVDYSSGSDSGEEIESSDEIDREEEKEEEEDPIKNNSRSGYRIGDGGALSSVCLLWICKQGSSGKKSI